MNGIEEITVKRFKKLNDTTLGLGKFNILIGSNNSGKSSILQALHFAVSIAQSAKLEGKNVSWMKDVFSMSIHPESLLYAPIADVQALAHGIRLKASKKQAAIQKAKKTQQPKKSKATIANDIENSMHISLQAFDGAKCDVTIKKGRNSNISISISGKVLGERLMSMTEPYTIYAPGLAGIPREEKLLSAPVVRRAVARGDANLVLRNILWLLYKQGVSEKKSAEINGEAATPVANAKINKNIDGEDVWSKFMTQMRAIFPGISIEIDFDPETDEHIPVSFRRAGEPSVPIDAAGTSILQASQLLAYSLLYKPAVLILDEPDSHLDPINQRRLCSLLDSLSSKLGFQVILSTHSRHVLDSSLENPGQRVIWMNDGVAVAGDHSMVASGLLEMGALDSAEFFATGTSRLKCLVATEDSSAESLSGLRALLRCNGFNLEETEIRSYAGCSKIESAIFLCNFLKEKAPALKVIIHRDWDYLDDSELKKLSDSIEKAGGLFYATPMSDIEGSFLEAKHLAHANPPLTEILAQDILNEAEHEKRDESLTAFIQQLNIVARKTDAKPDYAQISVTAMKTFNASPEKYSRGKILAGNVKAKIQATTGKKPIIFSDSPYLIDEKLTNFSKKIWKR